MATIRAFKSAERVSTAVLIKDNKVLQTYPCKVIFDSETAWREAWSGERSDKFIKVEKSKTPKIKAHVNPTHISRMEKEIAEFLDRDYMWMIDTLRRDEMSLSGTLKDGRTFKVNYDVPYFPLRPAIIEINNVNMTTTINLDDWCPALTSARLLMILAYTTLETSTH